MWRVFFPGNDREWEDQRHHEPAAGAHRPEFVADGKPAELAEQEPPRLHKYLYDTKLILEQRS